MALIRRLIAVPAVAALAAGACAESTAPSAVDPSAMATAVNGLSGAFSGNAAFQSLSVLSKNFTLTAAGAAQRAPRRGLADRAPVATLALFPANVLGKTFVWDTAAGGKYRIVDSTLAGAPSAGVRFWLYVTNTATGRPALPLQKIGYVDLIDVSTPQANAIRVPIQFGSQSIADYTITGVKTTTSLTLTASGYITDGVSQTVFDMSHQISLADSSVVLHDHVTGNGTSVSLSTSASGSGGTGALQLDWLVAKNNATIEVAGSGTATSVNLQFKFNGTTWATVSGNPSATPSITGANGRQLTAAELVALGQILQGLYAIYGSLDSVFAPSFLVFR